MNKLNKIIQFTFENKVNDEIPILDVLDTFFWLRNKSVTHAILIYYQNKYYLPIRLKKQGTKNCKKFAKNYNIQQE